MTGIIALAGDPDRFAEAGRLARLYPSLKVVLSDNTTMSEALAQLGGGIDPSRLLLETRSANTYENAGLCAELVKPMPDQHWLLVTGALHMPRAIASFRMAGFNVEPWPVYDRTASELSMVTEAVHEWLGLVAYKLLGRTAHLFPM